MVGSLIYKF